jgi:hypothetical protein
MSQALVRIRAIPETTALGLAGLVGEVYGWSVPSSTGVSPIIGPVPSDFVISVYLADRGEQVWIAPEWTDDMGDGTGRTAPLAGVPVHWVQRADDEWEELPAGTEPGEVQDASVLRALWASIHGPRRS